MSSAPASEEKTTELAATTVVTVKTEVDQEKMESDGNGASNGDTVIEKSKTVVVKVEPGTENVTKIDADGDAVVPSLEATSGTASTGAQGDAGKGAEVVVKTEPVDQPEKDGNEGDVKTVEAVNANLKTEKMDSETDGEGNNTTGKSPVQSNAGDKESNLADGGSGESDDEEDDDDDDDDDDGGNHVGPKQDLPELMEDDCNETVSEQLAMENERLQKVLLGLSERQAVLEEFIEVEYGDKFDKFLNNRQRLVNVMGLENKDSTVTNDGRRSAKSHELVGLLKVVKEQAAGVAGATRETAGTSSGRDFNTGASTNYGRAEPAPSTHQGNFNNAPFPGRGGKRGRKNRGGESEAKRLKMPKTCVCCYLTDHFIEQCPYKGEVWNPRVAEEIGQRRRAYFQALKQEKNRSNY